MNFQESDSDSEMSFFDILYPDLLLDVNDQIKNKMVVFFLKPMETMEIPL